MRLMSSGISPALTPDRLGWWGDWDGSQAARLAAFAAALETGAAAVRSLDETYLYPGDSPSKIRFDVTLPKGKLWLLGDHRRISYDSQEKGPLAVRVVGQAYLILRHGHAIFLRAPQTFVADGLAPADTRTPPALTGVAVSILASLSLLALTIIGVIRHVLRVSRRPSR